MTSLDQLETMQLTTIRIGFYWIFQQQKHKIFKVKLRRLKKNDTQISQRCLYCLLNNSQMILHKFSENISCYYEMLVPSYCNTQSILYKE